MSSDHTASSRSCGPSGPSRIRVVLVDDDGLIRQGLRKIVENCVSLEVVGEASNGLKAIEAVRLLRPDVVVMDINMPQMNGIDATKCIKGEFPDTVVIGLSVAQGSGTVQEMESAGIYAYLAKESAVGVLCQAIEDAVAHTERRKVGG